MRTVAKSIKYLMTSSPYYGLFAVGLNKRFVPHLGTAAVSVDGINYELLIDKDYWYSKTDKHRVGILWHELLHIVLFHLPNYDDYIKKFPNKLLLNVAMDLSVESYIPEEFWDYEGTAEMLFKEFPTLPKRQSVKYYWDFLNSLKSHANGQGGDSEQGSNSSNQNSNSSDQDFDSEQSNCYESMLETFDQKSETKQKEIIDSISCENYIHCTWDQITSSQDWQSKKDLIIAQTEFQMKNTAQNCRGHFPAEIACKLQELLTPKPPIFNWKAYFRRVLGISFDIYNKKTRRKESKRFSESPGLKLKKKHKILVAIDTSGSVNDKELAEFFNEIKHIYKAGAEIFILECDADISAKYKYTGKTPEIVHGRGGTSFIPAIDFYNQSDYTTCVYFTDGYGDQDKCHSNKQIIWVITSYGNQESKFPGMKICIPNNN